MQKSQDSIIYYNCGDIKECSDVGINIKFRKEEVNYGYTKLSKLRFATKLITREENKVDKKIEKVIDSILNVLIAIVGEILKNQKQEDEEKEVK